MRFEESPATEEEDSYSYRLEWDDYQPSLMSEGQGPGSEMCGGFDNAWDLYKHCSEGIKYIGVRLIRIDADGNETVYAP